MYIYIYCVATHKFIGNKTTDRHAVNEQQVPLLYVLDNLQQRSRWTGFDDGRVVVEERRRGDELQPFVVLENAGFFLQRRRLEVLVCGVRNRKRRLICITSRCFTNFCHLPSQRGNTSKKTRVRC